jgi:hypothetical protein
MIRDIPEEHFDEAADLFHRRCLALDDLELDMTDLRVLDARIRAHLDGLRLGGGLSMEIARPALTEGSPEEAFVATTLALEIGRPEAIAEVEAALAADPTDAFEGIVWGLRLSRSPGTTALLRRLLASADEPTRDSSRTTRSAPGASSWPRPACVPRDVSGSPISKTRSSHTRRWRTWRSWPWTPSTASPRNAARSS